MNGAVLSGPSMDYEAENRRFFEEYDPELLKELAGVDSGMLTPEPAKKGGWAVRLEGRWVHSKYDPAREAEKAARGDGAPLHLHFGFGLGFFLDADQLGEGAKTLIFEPCRELAAAALRLRPLADLFRRKGAVLCCAPARFKQCLSQLIKGRQAFKAVVSPWHAAAMPRARKWFDQAIAEAGYQSEMGLATLERLAPVFTESALRALPHVFRLPGVERLEGLFRGEPAVIVSAGPSLDKNLALLEPVQDLCLIIALARTAKPLERCGIRPHLLVHNEPKPYFHTICDCGNLSETAFVLCEQAETRFFEHQHGPTFVFQNPANFAGRWVDRHFPELAKANLETGGSAATEAFSTAALAGCDPIILLGQDLSVSGDRYYAAAEANFKFPHTAADERWVPGYLGGQAKTLHNYLSFLLWFQDRAAALAAGNRRLGLVNATEGGARLDGFRGLKCREAVRRWFIKRLDAAARLAEAAHADRGRASPEAMAVFLRDGVDRARRLRRLCGRFQEREPLVRRQLRKLSPENAAKARQSLDKLDALLGQFSRELQELSVLNGFIQAELNQIKSMRRADVAAATGDAFEDFAMRAHQDLDAQAATLKAVDAAAGRFVDLMGSILPHIS